MKSFDNDKVHSKLINKLDRAEKQQAYQRDRFFKFKLPEIHSSLAQTLLMEKIVETDNPAAVTALLLKGMKQMIKASEFDFTYFIAPLRGIIARPNTFSLYITQYILEVIMNDPNVVDVYGTDEDIYRVVNRVVSNINMKFERTEEKIMEQLSKKKSLVPGSRDYDIALEEAIRKGSGDSKVHTDPK